MGGGGDHIYKDEALALPDSTLLTIRWGDTAGLTLSHKALSVLDEATQRKRERKKKPFDVKENKK